MCYFQIIKEKVIPANENDSNRVSKKLILDKTNNAKKGIVTGLINKVITLLIPFIVRTIFIRVIGIEYAGLNSLFTSILQVLNLAELGFASAVVYSMYKPIAERDDETICALLNFYRRVYKIVGMIVLIAGVLVLPFIKYFINGDPPEGINLYVVYFIFLFNTSISYLLYGYKTSLLNAYQRTDVINNIGSITTLGLNVAHIIVLLLIPNYYLYIVFLPFFTIINNLIVSWTVDKMFPQYKCVGTITAEIRSDLRRRIAGLAIQRVCVMTRNSLSSIVLSTFISLSVVGIYNNYYMVISAVSGVINIILTSMLAGVGNTIQTQNKKQNFQSMRKFTFLYMWIGAYSAICLTAIFQPFMELWVGKDYMLPLSSVLLFGLYFFNLKLGDISSIYYNATGLWWYGKWRAILEAVANLMLSLLFVQFWGINGVLIATLGVHFFINILYGTSILFQHYFGYSKMWKYYGLLVYYMFSFILVFGITYFFCLKIEGAMHIVNVWAIMTERLLMCTFLSNLILFLLYFKTLDYKWAISWVRVSLIKKNN